MIRSRIAAYVLTGASIGAFWTRCYTYVDRAREEGDQHAVLRETVDDEERAIVGAAGNAPLALLHSYGVMTSGPWWVVKDWRYGHDIEGASLAASQGTWAASRR